MRNLKHEKNTTNYYPPYHLISPQQSTLFPVNSVPTQLCSHSTHRYEEESRERGSLRVQVVAQALLALVESVRERGECLQAIVARAGVDYVRVLGGGYHDGLEGFVDGVELLRLLCARSE